MSRIITTSKVAVPVLAIVALTFSCSSGSTDTEPAINGIPGSVGNAADGHGHPVSLEDIFGMPHLGFATGTITRVEPVIDVWAAHGGVGPDERTLEPIVCSHDAAPALRFVLTDVRTTWSRDGQDDFTFYVGPTSTQAWTTVPVIRANSHTLEWWTMDGAVPTHPQPGLIIGVIIVKSRSGELISTYGGPIGVDQDGWIHDFPFESEISDRGGSVRTDDLLDVAARIPGTDILDTSSLVDVGRVASYCHDLGPPQEHYDEQNRLPSSDAIPEEPPIEE